MSGETLNKPTGIFIRASITLKEYQYTVESSTQTIIVTNFPRSGHDATFVSGEFPILLNVADLSEEHDELMPRVGTSSITISNKAESLGFQRRFSDLLEYYTVNEQAVTITFHSYKQNENDITTGSALSTWALIANDIMVDLEKETITINLKNNVLTDKVITKDITSSEFPNAPVSSIGKYLPLAIGASVPVIATRISATEYALTTTIGTSNEINQVVNYYGKHPDGTFRRVIGTAGTSTNLVTAGLSTLNATRTLGVGIAFPLRVHSDYLIHAMTLQLTGTSTPTATGTITVQIVESKIPINASKLGYFKSDADYTVLGTASIDKANHVGSINSTADFSPSFTFDTPIVFSPSSRPKATYPDFTYFYVIVKDSNPAKPVSLKMYNNPSSGSFGSELTYVGGVWTETTLYNQAIHTVTGMTLTLSTGSTADDNGLGYSKVTTGTVSTCDATSLQLGAVVDGLEYGGVTSGYVYQILPMLFSSSEYDSSDTFTSHGSVVVGQTYGRIVAGATSGRTTRLQLARELLRNSGCRLISLASSGSAKVALYAWGNQLTRQGVIDDRFMTTTKIGIGDRRSVINNLTASYSKDVLNRTASDLLEQGGSTGFSKVLANQRLTGSSSVTLYGSNDLGNGNFNYINDDTSMTNMVAFYHRNYEHPYKFVEFYIPFAPGFTFPDSSGLVGTSLKCSHVVDLVTYQLPAFYGSSALPLNPVDDGELVVETSGYDFTRAKRYRVQIESKKITFKDEIPVLYFTCKILDNVNNPT